MKSDRGPLKAASFELLMLWAVTHSDEHFSTARLFHSLTRSEVEARTLALARAKVEGESTPSSPSIRS